MRAKRMSVKRFCERCLEVFDEVYETGQKYVITKNGKGVIRVVPPEGWELSKKRKTRQRKKS